MQFRRKRKTPVEIGLIPMIDVLLVLLFFFMVATTFRHHTDLKINLPEAEGSESEQPGKVHQSLYRCKRPLCLGERGRQGQAD